MTRPRHDWLLRFMGWALTSALLSSNCFAGGGAHPERASHAMVVSQQELASQAGIAILKAGGNAVDAAVATGFALAVVLPNAGNIGGGGFMLLRLKNGEAHFVDFRETAPALATAKMYQDSQGNVVPNLSVLGFKAIGVPGSVKGLVYAQEHFGKLTLARVMAPAVLLARNGYALSWDAVRLMNEDKDLTRFADSRRIFQNDGHGWKPGDLFKQPKLALTLERIARAPDEFYTGQMAREIAEFIRRGGGLITTQDLAHYEVKERQPLRGRYRGAEIISAPPPSSGGTALIETLNILERFNLGQAGPGSAKSIHLIAESYRRAFYDRAQFMGDPDSTPIPVSELIDKEYAKDWSSSIDDQHPTASLRLQRPSRFPELDRYARQHPIFGASAEPHHTTHYSVVDADGNAVAVTTTLNDDYGSRVTIGSLGFILNNEMDDFAAKPGVPNIYGLIQGEANAVGPNKRPLSAMAPTIVLKDGQLWLVLGAEGGPTIITSVANILIGMRDYGLDIQEAVNAPRIHQQWLPDRIELEKGRFSPDTVHLLQQAGNEVTPPDIDGDAECIAIDLATGTRMGASDARNESGRAVGY